MLNSMLVNKDFQTWHLIGCCTNTSNWLTIIVMHVASLTTVTTIEIIVPMGTLWLHGQSNTGLKCTGLTPWYLNVELCHGTGVHTCVISSLHGCREMPTDHTLPENNLRSCNNDDPLTNLLPDEIHSENSMQIEICCVWMCLWNWFLCKCMLWMF